MTTFLSELREARTPKNRRVSPKAAPARKVPKNRRVNRTFPKVQAPPKNAKRDAFDLDSVEGPKVDYAEIQKHAEAIVRLAKKFQKKPPNNTTSLRHRLKRIQKALDY